MIVVAFVLLTLGWLLEYCGFTNTDPRDEITAAFNGGHSPNKGMQGASLAPGVGSDTSGAVVSGSGGAATNAGGNNVGRAANKTGHMAMLPLHVCIRPGIQVDRGIAPEVIRLCDTYHVRVSSGKRFAPGSDHMCGGAADFVGTSHNLRALYNAATRAGYAYVEPWADSNTVGVMGTTGAHVHISFFRCNIGQTNPPGASQ